MTVPGWYRRLFLLYPPSFRDEAEAELLEMAEADWAAARARRRGAVPVTAARLALDLLGTAARAWIRVAVRPSGRAGVWDGIRLDLRYAWRALARSPGFVAVAVAVIGLGVGATTTMLSTANALLLRRLPGLVRPEELFTVHARGADGSSFHSFSYPDFRDYRAAGTDFDLAGYTIFPASLSLGGEPEFTGGFAVTGSYFPILGPKPALGRLLAPADDRGVGGERVVVLSHDLWRSRFGGDSTVVGRAVTLNGQPFTVVGVAEAGFRGHVALFAAALWVPIDVSRPATEADFLGDPRLSFLEIVGRTRGDPAAVEARLSPIATRLGRARGDDWDRTVDVRPFSAVPVQVRTPVIGFLGLLVLLGGLILLISSTNIAGVMVARGMARARETAVRLAVGAGRGRLIRHLVAESLVVFALGGVVGTALAWVATDAAAGFRPPMPIPLVIDLSLDGRVLAASLGMALLAGLAFGLVPALRATAPGVTAALKDDGTLGGMGRTRLRSVLVTAQVAGSTLLIVTAGLFVRALGKAGRVDLGFDPAGVHVSAVDLSLLRYDAARTRAFIEQVERNVAAIPGVTAVGTVDLVPLAFGNQGTVVSIEGREEREGIGFFGTDFALVSPGYLETMGVEIVRGRRLTEADRDGAPDVAVINETLAERIWPGENPIGKRFRWGEIRAGRPTTVVGVARNGKYRSIGEEPVSMVYRTIAQEPVRATVYFVARQSRPSPAIGPAMKAAIQAVDPNLPLMSNLGFEEQIGLGLLPNRVAAILATAFGAVGLGLAAVGLYGVLSYLVVRRRRELGIRIALGAPAGRVRRMVLGGGLKLAAIGLAIGTVAALLLARGLRSLLFGLDSLDLVSVLGSLAVLAAAAALASDLPARRAATTEPMEALRHE